MTTGKDDLTKATSLGYNLGYDTRNASATYHAAALGFSDSIRFEGKENVINTYPTPHEPYGYHLNASEVPLANGSRVNAFRAHRACLIGGPDSDLCQRDTYPADLYEDDWTAAQAVSLLERAPHEKPWFLSVSFSGPHDPFAVTAQMAAAVTGRDWPAAVDSDNKTPLCEPAAGAPSHARVRCNYAAMMENLDRLFGVVLDAAAARGNSVDRDTVVCFFSDHGEMLNDHNYTDKSQPWQGAIAVPLVCAGPGIRRNASVDVPMATVDIGATMLDFAGAERDSGMTALSFRGLLEGADPQTRNRTVVLSGLQSYDFGAPPDPNMDIYDKFGVLTYNFRLAVAEFDGTPYKFVCCKGRCPGAPSPVGKPDADGYTRLLYDTAADPFDMHDVKAKLPHVAEKLRAALPVEHGFKCSRAAS
uniref:Sulfatase N-terminal domain-containing protein n=1 Tax=Prymnesium polylepis TaxID=72548 RepID=A0A7S4M1C3_9EUKA